MERVGREVSKLLPRELRVEVVRVPCLGRVRLRLVIKSVMQKIDLLDATCSMYIVIKVDNIEDT